MCTLNCSWKRALKKRGGGDRSLSMVVALNVHLVFDGGVGKDKAVTAATWCLRFKASQCYVTYDCSCFFSLICPETLGFSCKQNKWKLNAGLCSFYKMGFWFNNSKKYFTSHIINTSYHMAWLTNKIIHDTHCQHLIFFPWCALLMYCVLLIPYSHQSTFPILKLNQTIISTQAKCIVSTISYFSFFDLVWSKVLKKKMLLWILIPKALSIKKITPKTKSNNNCLYANSWFFFSW